MQIIHNRDDGGMNEESRHEVENVDEPIDVINPRYPLSGTPGEVLTTGESEISGETGAETSTENSGESGTENSVANNSGNDQIPVDGDQTVSTRKDLSTATNTPAVEDSSLQVNSEEVLPEGELSIPPAPSSEPTGGAARIVVLILSVVLLILGVLILIGIIEMNTLVGVFFVASGAAGMTLQALPIIARLGLPSYTPSDGGSDHSRTGLNR